TAVAGSDPSRSVVDPMLESHAVRGLYVMDASVFPTNMGVNPQHSIMAIVWRAAEQLARRAEQRAAA
nr:GMC family oxidoreductase [Myxococcota bacterium]